jgi:hypothetical protein
MPASPPSPAGLPAPAAAVDEYAPGSSLAGCGSRSRWYMQPLAPTPKARVLNSTRLELVIRKLGVGPRDGA